MCRLQLMRICRSFRRSWEPVNDPFIVVWIRQSHMRGWVAIQIIRRRRIRAELDVGRCFRLRNLGIGTIVNDLDPRDAVGIKPEIPGEVPNQLNDLGYAARNHRHPQLYKKAWRIEGSLINRAISNSPRPFRPDPRGFPRGSVALSKYQTLS